MSSTAFVLDASFALHWCFEDESTPATNSVLAALQESRLTALVPAIWVHEMLNGLGKGVTRNRLARETALKFWREIGALPVQIVPTSDDQRLLELAIDHNLAVYDACYLEIALRRQTRLATGDGKLASAAAACGLQVIGI